MSERVLGRDYVVLKGRGQRDIYNGATCKGDNFMHLGLLLEGKTACGKLIEGFMATYSDVEIDCLACIAKLRGKSEGIRD